MLEPKMFADKSASEREAIFRDSCDGVEELGYTKQFTSEQLEAKKDELAEASIERNQIEDEKKEAMDEFKARLKPVSENIKQLLTDIKHKSQYVNETVYKFIDRENNMVGFYNREGDMVFSRPLNSQERQIQIGERRTGTHN